MPTLAPVKPADLSQSEAEKIAATIVDRLKITPATDLEQLIEERLGGKVLEDDTFDYGAIEVLGHRDFRVWLPSFLTEGDRRFTLAHEIGHYVLHSRFGEVRFAVGHGGLDDAETEANWFALALLMPKKKFQSLWARYEDPAAVADYFRVPLRMVATRLHMLGDTAA